MKIIYEYLKIWWFICYSIVMIVDKKVKRIKKMVLKIGYEIINKSLS